MRRFIYQQRNKITLISFILIILAYLSRYAISNDSLANIFFIIASVIGVIPIAMQAFEALKVKVVSIDLLVTIAVIGAFIIQIYEESAVVTFLFLFGAYLEAKTLNKTRGAIEELTMLAPDTAYLENSDGTIEEVTVDDLNIGDTIVVKTGHKIPVDGTIISGFGAVNEASITGESMYLEKDQDDLVYAGTLLENGTIRVKTQKINEDTTFGKIIELVEDAQDSKSKAERFIDKFARWYTPFVILLSLVVGLILHFGFNDPDALETAITILVLGCPGALVIGVPISNVSSIGNGAREGVLIKGSEIIQTLAKVDVIVFDKTGTLTKGVPEVEKIKYYTDDKKLGEELLFSVESESDHPLAKAITNHFGSATNKHEVSETLVLRGGGIQAKVNNKNVLIGNEKLVKEYNITLTKEMESDILTLQKGGNSIIITAIDNTVYNIIGIKDQLREGIEEEIQRLKKLNIKQFILLSGDNQASVDLVANKLKLTEAYGNMLPEDKAKYIGELKAKGLKVAFVGDGINDAPSLAAADVSIAMGNGTDVAIEVSDVILVNDNINKLSHAVGLAKKTVANMYQNIVIALVFVFGLLIAVIGFNFMTMSIGMFLHQGSHLLVILNGMRLLRYKVK